MRREHIPYTEDSTSFDEADDFDFLINGFKIDVKTRTEKFHIRTLEMVEQAERNPKDIYIAAHYHRDTGMVDLIGAISLRRLKQLNQIENHGYKNNYVAYDRDLGSMDTFKAFITTNRKGTC